MFVLSFLAVAAKEGSLSGTYQSVYVFIPLKAGDTIKFNTTGFYKQYQIYGVR